MNIIDFLEARIAEDEARSSSGWARLGDSRWETTNEGQDFLTPSAVLAECAAKRSIIGLHAPVDPCDAHDVMSKTTTCDTLRALAAVYKDHADYDKTWQIT